jgi:hypothetical protein
VGDDAGRTAFRRDEGGGRCLGRHLGTTREVPGTAAVDQGGPAEALSVSCASAGNCAAAGWYAGSSGGVQAFVASEVNGTWNTYPSVIKNGTAGSCLCG